jgi:HSP20 family protein
MDRPVRQSSTDQSISGMVTRLTRGQGGGYELYERDGSYVLSIELPGFSRDEISVQWHDGTVVVDAVHEAANPNRSREAHKRYRVSVDIDPEEIQARYRHGVLDVYLPPLESDASTTIPVED